MRNPQLKLLKNLPKAYGGTLRNTVKGRAGPRPLATKNTIHLTLRSSQAKGDWSFMKKDNPKKIAKIVKKFSAKYGVNVISLANVGNHLHFHIQLATRHTYRKFIKAVTSAIVMKITGASRMKKLKKHFWDYRPFTRVVIGFKARLHLKNYLEINELEGQGWNRAEAIDIIRDDKEKFG